MPRGLARKVAVPRGTPSPSEGNPLRHSNVLHVDFPDACKGAVAPRGCHAEFFLAGGKLCQGVPSLLGARCVGHLLMVDSAYVTFNMSILPY